jgi:Uncharacterized conserved protein
MAIEKVKAFFAAQGRVEDVQEFEVSSATVELAAQALNTDGARIAKTLALYDVDGGVMLIVVAGDAKIDNRKFREQYGHKAKFCSAEDTLSATGHAVGGVCPFALEQPLPVYLDVSLRRFCTVFPACGSANSVIELGVDELETLSGAAQWVDVCKGWQPEN